MAVLRVVSDFYADDPQGLARFYEDLLGLDIAMNMEFVVTLGGASTQSPQVSFMNQGGSGAPVPALSIEVDNLDEVLAKARDMAAPVEYGPTDEPWGVRRFFIRDPAGRLINILTHME